MQIKKQGFRGSRSLPGHDVKLSSEARKRLKWMDYYEGRGRNAALTARYFGISRETFHSWRRRYDPSDLCSLEGRSHRPRRVRRPTWSAELYEAVRDLRREEGWGKDKLAAELRKRGRKASVSMVGRILGALKRRGELKEPARRKVWAQPRTVVRPYAIRKPKDYEISKPGDLVEIDTLDVRPRPGTGWKQFTGCDVVSRWNVAGLHGRATAGLAGEFCQRLEERMPFPIRAVQVDGGSEFKEEFEQECRRRGWLLFVLPPRSPKLNGHVERAHRTHREEFYQRTDLAEQLAGANRQLMAWERKYNTARPHQSLGYLTPAEYVARWRGMSGNEAVT